MQGFPSTRGCRVDQWTFQVEVPIKIVNVGQLFRMRNYPDTYNRNTVRPRKNSNSRTIRKEGFALIAKKTISGYALANLRTGEGSQIDP